MFYLLGISIVFKKGKYIYIFLYIAVYKSRLYIYSTIQRVSTRAQHVGLRSHTLNQANGPNILRPANQEIQAEATFTPISTMSSTLAISPPSTEAQIGRALQTEESAFRPAETRSVFQCMV